MANATSGAAESLAVSTALVALLVVGFSLHGSPSFRVPVAPASRDALQVRFVTSRGSRQFFNTIVPARIGFANGPDWPSWTNCPDRDAWCSLAGLPKGRHLLMAGPTSPRRTAFHVTSPGRVNKRTLTLSDLPQWPAHESIGDRTWDAWSHKVHVETAASGDEIVVFRFTNHSKTTIRLRPEDVRFIVFGYARMVSSPRLIIGNEKASVVMGQEDTRWIVGPQGQTTVRVNWPNCVRNAIWSWGDTNGPYFEPDDPTRVGVRPCIRNSGALSIELTSPEVILGTDSK